MSDTYHLIDRKVFDVMKPTAYLINTARGGVVNQDDLIEVLTKREIAGAGLDVFEHEPLANSPLSRLDNVILTAHTAGVDTLASEEMAYLAAKTAVEVLRGVWPADVIINPEALRKV